MAEKRESAPACGRSMEKHINATRRQIATYFCGTCTAETVDIDGCLHVVFNLKVAGVEEMSTAPIPVEIPFMPDPIEYFVREIFYTPRESISES